MDRDKLSGEIAVIVVTHNSAASIDQTLESLAEQSVKPGRVVLIDSGSSSTEYLKKYLSFKTLSLELCFMPNIGFSAANNLGFNSLESRFKYVLFLNPDVILPPDFIQSALEWIEKPAHHKVGAFSGALWGWDLLKKQPTGRLDSTGIFTTFYGRWYDRGQGDSAKYSPYTKEESVDALCGALFFASREALESVKLSDGSLFEPTFFCYKEDIELSLRLRKKGWQLIFVPELIAYHARGWQKERSRVPRALRLLSAKNELKLHLKGGNPLKIAYSACKWVGVKVFNL